MLKNTGILYDVLYLPEYKTGNFFLFLHLEKVLCALYLCTKVNMLCVAEDCCEGGMSSSHVNTVLI